MKTIKLVEQTLDIRSLKSALNGGIKDDSQINISQVQIGQVVIADPDYDTALMRLLERTPEPRLENLTKNALRVSLNKFKFDFQAGDFLGMSRRRVSYQQRQLNSV